MSEEHVEHPQKPEMDTTSSGIAPYADGLKPQNAFARVPQTDVREFTRKVASNQQTLQKLREGVVKQIPDLSQFGKKTAALAATSALARRDMGEQIRRLARATVPFTAAEQDFARNLGRVLDAHRQTWSRNLGNLVKQALELIPANLRSLALEDLREVMRINEEDGTSLAWAPRVSIVEELIAAPDIDARSAVLVARIAEIANDVDASLAVVTLPEHQILRSLVADSVSALRVGLYGPAQAAATTALDTLLYVHVLDYLQHDPERGKADTRKHFQALDVEEWNDASVAEVELVLVGAGLLTAFRSWRRGRGRPSFNRNGSIHQADDGAYSPAHAVRAVLMAQALMRWLDDSLSKLHGITTAA
ncbi:hypothetical protein IF655_05715 [Streptomyces sp. DSM 110735]|uniref:hypothetical protein n=1 Tax=Streptomyces sp. DSM 110735 TaxID=2775031 RepID=UPI0018F4ED84|nr:hypothetical protein [Streptomyces sp. DSM 110735]MBJ7902792.1 hypothetical protein [Streptomyces sp. DSM 110735]